MPLHLVYMKERLSLVLDVEVEPHIGVIWVPTNFEIGVGYAAVKKRIEREAEGVVNHPRQ